MDYRKIAEDVYTLANDSNNPLGNVVKEALQVIDECLDTHGWVRISSFLQVFLLFYSITQSLVF